MPTFHGLYLGMNAKPWQWIYETSSTAQHPLGAFFDDEFGRRFRYALNGASALKSGYIVMSPTLAGATTTLQSQAVVSVAASAGDTRVYVNAVTTAQAADTFTDGWAAIYNATVVEIYTRRIKYNSALATSGTSSYIDLYEPVPVNISTTFRVALQANPYKNIQTMNANRIPTGLPLGGVNTAVPASHYCWVQTRGLFGFHVKDVTTQIGIGAVGPAGTTGGTLVTAAEADTAAAYTPVIGWSTAAWLDEGSGFVYLRCE